MRRGVDMAPYRNRPRASRRAPAARLDIIGDSCPPPRRASCVSHGRCRAWGWKRRQAPRSAALHAKPARVASRTPRVLRGALRVALTRDAARYPARPARGRAMRHLGRSPAQDFGEFPALQGLIHRPGHPRQGHAREKRPGMPLATSVAPAAGRSPWLSGATFVPSLTPGPSPPEKRGGERPGRTQQLPFPEIPLDPCEKREGSRPNPAASGQGKARDARILWAISKEPCFL